MAFATGEVGKAYVTVSADLKPYQRGLRQAEAQLKQFGEKMARVGRSLTMRVTLPLGAVGVAATKMAMDVVESENLFTVSMGKMAGATRAWSDQLQQSLGLNAFEIRKMAGTFNVMLTSMGVSADMAYEMSRGLTQLSHDMASFYNLPIADAFQKLQAGLSGEIEPLKRLGILILDAQVQQKAYTSGLAETGTQLNQVQKVMARYLLIMDATAKAQGDLARTIDSPANRLRLLGTQLKMLAIEIGQQLMPHIIRMMAGFQSLVKYLRALDDATKNNIMRWAVYVAAAGPIVWATGKIIVAMAGIVRMIRAITMGAVAMQALLGPAAWLQLAAGVAVAVGVMYTVKKAFDAFSDTATAVSKDAKSLGDDIYQNLAEKMRGALTAIRPLGQSLAESFDRTRESLDKILERLDRLRAIESGGASLKARFLRMTGHPEEAEEVEIRSRYHREIEDIRGRYRPLAEAGEYTTTHQAQYRKELAMAQALAQNEMDTLYGGGHAWKGPAAGAPRIGLPKWQGLYPPEYMKQAGGAQATWFAGMGRMLGKGLGKAIEGGAGSVGAGGIAAWFGDMVQRFRYLRSVDRVTWGAGSHFPVGDSGGKTWAPEGFEGRYPKTGPAGSFSYDSGEGAPLLLKSTDSNTNATKENTSALKDAAAAFRAGSPATLM